MSEFLDPLVLCETKLSELKEAKSSLELSNEVLRTERDQVLHAIKVAQALVGKHDDAIVRKRVEKQAYERAEGGIATAYDQIVLSTGDIVDIAHNLNPSHGGVSDSDNEDEEDRLTRIERGPAVIR